MKKWLSLHLSTLLMIGGVASLVLALWLYRIQYVRFISIEPPPGMRLAGLYLSNEIKEPAGILVLCNGINQHQGGLIEQWPWRSFARKNRLVLAEIAFMSDVIDYETRTGYYFADKGSGEALLAMLDALYPQKPPLLMFGFSAGGHFVSRFQEWRPERVAGWAVTGVNTWDEPTVDAREYPPGIIMIGDLEIKVAESAAAFRKRLEQGRTVLWCGLDDMEHVIPYFALPMVREFLKAVLEPAKCQWGPVECGGMAAGWTPNEKVKALWEELEKTPPFFEEDGPVEEDDPLE